MIPRSCARCSDLVALRAVADHAEARVDAALAQLLEREEARRRFA
jgi:hypothetical protein